MSINKIRKICMLFVFTTCFLFLTSCKTKETSPEQSKQPIQTSNNPEEKIIDIYTINEETMEVEASKATIAADGDLKAKDIVASVIDGLNFEKDYIGLNDVTEKEDMVIVDFKKDKPPVSQMGSSGETAVLDCISMSLLDNLEFCQKVVFHVDGERYISEHFAFEYEEAYKWK